MAGCGEAPPTVVRGQYPIPRGADVSKAEPGRYGGVLVQAMSQEPRTFNPLVMEDAYSSRIVDIMLSALVTYDPVQEKVVPALAESWKVSRDHRSYLFFLREGVRWSDGRPLTVDDVVFTFSVIFDSRYSNRYSQQYTIGGEPMGVFKVSERAVLFTTRKVYAPFLETIGYLSILPRHRLQSAAERGDLQKQWTSRTAIRSPQAIIASGPFRLRRYQPGQRLLLEPNPHYWRVDQHGRRLPYIDHLIIPFVADRSSALILFATGQSDLSEIDVGDEPWVARAARTYDFTIHDRGPASGISFMWFNQHPGKNAQGQPYLPPYKLRWFQNRRFRQALAMAIDRPGLIKALYFGKARPLHTMISPANRRWHNSETRRYPYDPVGARELLQKAGFVQNEQGELLDSQGRRVGFRLLLSQGRDSTLKIAATIKENMAALGIEMELQILDFSTLVARVADQFDYDAALMGFTGGGDPSGGKAIYRSDGRLHIWYPQQKQPATSWEARIDTLMDAQEQALEFTDRKQYVDEIQAIFSEQLPLIFLLTPNAYVGVQNRWQNVRIPVLGAADWNIDEWWVRQ